MKKQGIVLVLMLAGSSASAQQIQEQVYPVAPVSPMQAQIQAVQQAERQIQAQEQAVALERARAAQRQAAAEARAAAARAAAKKEAVAKQQKYEDELRALDLESRKLDIETKRSNVETDVVFNKARQERARDFIEKELQGPSSGSSAP